MLKIIYRQLFYPILGLMILGLSLLWLLNSHYGTKTLFFIVQTITPGTLTAESVEGHMMDRIHIKKLMYQNDQIKCIVNEIAFSPGFILHSKSIDLKNILLKDLLFLSLNHKSKPLLISQANLSIKTTLNRKNSLVNIQKFSGYFSGQPFSGTLQLEKVKGQFKTPLLFLKFGSYTAEVTESSWTVDSNLFNLTGTVSASQNVWQGQISEGYFKAMPGFDNLWKLKKSALFEITPNSLSIENLEIFNPKTLTKITSILRYKNNHFSIQFEIPSYFLPKQNITFKNLTVSLSGFFGKPLNLTGKTFLNKEPIILNGLINLNQSAKSTVNIKGDKLLLYNTRDIKIIASPAVRLDYEKNIFYLTGNLGVYESYINMESQKNNLLLSKDVVIINPTEKANRFSDFKFISSIYVTIKNQLHVTGYSLDGIVGGKLLIQEREDGVLTGNGKLTIKEGKYRLQGSTRYIYRGHLNFPAGTLLRDPLLDIFISQHKIQRPLNLSEENVGIYVQGSLQYPSFSTYSSHSFNNKNILSKLGFSQTDSTEDDNQRQLLAQSAFLFSGGSNPLINNLEKNLELEEFNLESRQTQKAFNTQGSTDTVLVIGKSLSPKLYLQYLQSIMEPVTTVRLKYFLGRYFTVSGDTGTQGLGGDLTFSMEKD